MSDETKKPEEHSETDFIDKQSAETRAIAEALVTNLNRNLKRKQEEEEAEAEANEPSSSERFDRRMQELIRQGYRFKVIERGEGEESV
jgi:hypothetical protein